MAIHDIIMAAGGSAATSAAVYVEDVFSTYLYTGNGSSQTISNGIALGSSNGVTSLKLDFDSSLTDVSSNGYTGTVTGSAARNTSVSKFGSASLDGFDGASWVDYSSSAGNFGSGDWTVEFWIKTTGSGTPGIVTQASGAGAGATSWGIFQGYSTAGNVALYLSDGSTYFAAITTGTTVINDNAWHHIAACRSGSTAYLFLDGVLQGTASVGSTALGNGSLPIRVGGQGSGYALPSGTYIDDVRIVKGQALYTSAFTPPSSAASSITAIVGKGGLVWTKNRSSASYPAHCLFDTSRGNTNALFTNTTEPQMSGFTQTFTASGFYLGGDGYTNQSNQPYASWTFARQAKFFDILTITGPAGYPDLTVSHSLRCLPGMVIVKSIDGYGVWHVWHRSLPSTDELQLQSSNASSNVGTLLTVTSTTITIKGGALGAGVNYVVYLFADSNSGGFGPNGDQSVVACGSLTVGANGKATASLGWEPQFVLFKRTNTSSNWYMCDNMRGMPVGSADSWLGPHQLNAEDTTIGELVDISATGFTLSQWTQNDNLIYLAIRRGPMKTPTDATKVFNVQTYTGDNTSNRRFTTNFPIDVNLISQRSPAVYPCIGNRLIDGMHETFNNATTYDSLSTWIDYDDNNGFKLPTSYGYSNQSAATFVTASFRRAPGFMDCVCYSGSSSVDAKVHNLGVTPELIIIRARDYTYNWYVWHKDLGVGANGYYELSLNQNIAKTDGGQFTATGPTATTFTLNNYSGSNSSSFKYVAYLFATCPGVSKVGSFTISSSDINVDCGFSAGARFVLIKSINTTGGWLVCDTARGITTGNDPYLLLNATSAEGTTLDWFAPYSAGFTAKAATLGGATYIYLAIA